MTHNKLRVTGKEKRKTGKRERIVEVGTRKEHLIKLLEKAGKDLKLPKQKEESGSSLQERKLAEIQTALDCLKELEIREPKKAANNKGYWKFTLTLKHQTATTEENLEVVKQKWKEHPKTKSLATSSTTPIPETETSIDWQNICRTKLEKQKQLTSNRLMRADEMLFDINQIGVDLALVERKKPDNRSGDDNPQQSQSYKPDYEETEKLEYKDFLTKVLKSEPSKNIAIIGEPGAGKTTLLQRIAFWILENTNSLPIWIPLGILPTAAPTLKDYLLHHWLEDAIVRVTPKIKTEFEELLKAGRVWLLLDGVDEMVANFGNPLSFINNWIPGWCQHLSVMLTCRLNVWEANPHALNNFKTYRTLEFSPEKVEEFIQACFQNRRGAPTCAQELGIQLQQALNQPGKERIKDLVKNPLRLTLLCSTWHLREGKLPDTKAELYQQFVEEVYKWKKDEFPTTPEQREQLNAKLKELALEAIDKEENRFCLRHKFVESILGDREGSMFKLALNIGWQNQVGVDAKNPNPNQPVYAFFHPTFQEYFAALAVDDWDFFLPRAHDNCNPKPVSDRYRIFEPQWKEVFLLWLGRYELTHEQKNEFIKALVEFEDGCGKFYHYRSYFRAALGIIEFKECSFINKIIVQVCKHICEYYDKKKQEKIIITNSLKNEIQALLLKMDRGKVIDTLTQLYYTDQDANSCHKTALMFWEIEPSHPDVYTLLSDSLSNLINNYSLSNLISNYRDFPVEKTTEILATKNDHFIQLSKSFKRLVQSDANAVGVIIGVFLGAYRFQTGQLSQLEFESAVVLNGIIKTLIETPGILVSFLELYQSFYLDILPLYYDKQNKQEIRQQTLQIKGILASVNWLCTESGSIVRSKLWSKLRQSNPQPKTGKIYWLVGFDHNSIYSFRKKIINFITKICIESPDIIVDFLDCISNYFYEFNCLKKTYIVQDAEYTPDKIAALIRLLHSCKNKFSLWLVAYLLWKIDSKNPDLIAALTKLLHTCKEKSIHWQAAILLLQIDKSNLKAITTLTDCLHNCKNESILRQAVEILAEIGTSNSDTITALIQLLDTHADGEIGIKVAISLMKIGKSNLNAITALTKLLHTSANEKTCKLTTDILKEIDPGNLDAVATLTQLLKSQDKSIRIKAADNLWEINKGNPDASATLMDLLHTCQDQNTFKQVILSLQEKIGKSHPDVITALTKRLSNCENESIRIEAADNLWEMDKGNPDASATLMDLLHTCQDRNTFKQAILSLGTCGLIVYQSSFAELVNAGFLTDTLFSGTLFLRSSLQQKIGKSHPDVITALTKRLSNCENESIRLEAADNLWAMDKGNPDASATLIALMETSKDKSIRENLVRRLKKFAQPFLMAQVVTRLRSCLADKVKENDFKHYEACYDIIWHCAENMSYSEFYQAWHQQEEVEKTTTPDSQNLNQADLPQSLQSAITNDPQLSQIIHLIYIDSSQFIEPDNPAEIYDQMLDQNCPEYDPVPEIMSALKLYWNSLKRNSNKRPFLVFYSSSTHPYNQAFLTALSKFGREVCLITEQPIDHIPLKYFTPSQSIKDILEWIRTN